MQASPFSSISVIGAGAWGTALAELCARNGLKTMLWAREPEVSAAINETRENQAYLPGVSLSNDLQSTSDIAVAVQAEALVMVAPAQFARQVLASIVSHAPSEMPVILCSKGIERNTGLLQTEVLREVWPDARAAVLSGPSFAADVARGMPTAVTLACADAALGARWVASLGAPHFRLYLSDDLVGAELGGAVKNVIAIAAGAIDGKGLGESARAALIARGYTEFKRLGVALGAQPETMGGLAGLGDLILTASSPSSRNMSLGREIGRGRDVQSILSERNSVSEGVATAEAVASMARKAGVDMPICTAVADLVAGRRSLDEIIADILARPFRPEGE